MVKEKNIILEKLKSGDERFYEKLFREFYLPLTYYASKMINNIDAAKELVQELFVRIYEKRYGLKIETSLKAYLYKSVHNSCLNYINHMSIRERHHNLIKSEQPESAQLIEEEIFRTELEHKIYLEIEKLPIQCKNIFKMNRFEGLSNNDIAAKLNLSKRTVETQISKALKILRKKFANELLIITFVILLEGMVKLMVRVCICSNVL